MSTITIDSQEWESSAGKIKVVGIDGKTQASTLIHTTKSSGKFLIQRIIIRPTTVSGLVTPPVISVGQNATDYNDIVLTNALTGLTGLGISVINPDVNAKVVDANTGIYLKVATGATATTLTLRVYIIGFYDTD